MGVIFEKKFLNKIYRYWLLATITVIAGLRADAAMAQSTYEELQAVYIYNFAKYIQWPAENPVFVIAVYGGESKFSDILVEILQNKKIRGHEIQIKNMEKPEEMKLAQIIYVSASGSRELSDILEAVKDHNVLLVTEKDLIKKGAMISFLMVNNKLRFKINKEALDAAGMQASEGLLNLAVQ